jgi:hypothetical protein
MFPGWATGLVGFHSTGLNEPEEDRFIMDPAAEIQAILVSADAGISVAEFAQVIQGKKVDTAMWDPRTTGTWITTNVDTVIAIRQQYHP